MIEPGRPVKDIVIDSNTSIEKIFEELSQSGGFESINLSKGLVADLHPDKKEKFWRVYNDVKQEHYEKHYLIKKIFSFLDEPHTARQLSKVFNRSFARIMDILVELKKQKKITYFKVGSVGYWTIDNNLLIISKLKKNYLLFLDRPKQTSRVAKQFGVGWKSSFRRLKELEKLGLVKRGNDGKWIKLRTKKKILVI